MRVRAINYSDKDWTFGKGANDYRRDNDAVAQNIYTRLNSFLGDCFFDVGAGIDWFNRLGGKDLLTLKLDISSTILNTELVTGILQLSIDLNVQRQLTVSYVVRTAFSTSASTFIFDTPIG